MENAYYSVISPEGCAAILWKDRSKAADAAEGLKLTAQDLYEMGLIDDIIKEPLGGAQRNPAAATTNVKKKIIKYLGDLGKLGVKELLDARYMKFRKRGIFEEGKDYDETGGKD